MGLIALWSNPASYQFLVWPLVAAWAIFWLREPLGGLIARLAIRFDRKGFHATTAAGQGELQPLRRIAADFFDPALLTIQRDIFAAEFEKQNFESPAAKERELLDFAAALFIVGQFERTYAIIFGSQLGALHLLNSASEDGLPSEVLRPWYDVGGLKDAEVYANIAYPHWLLFLESSNLITRLPDDRICISIAGRAFLKYLVHQGYTLDKPL